MVVLDEDIFQVDSDRIKDIDIYMTVVDGKIAYQKTNGEGE